MKKSKHVYQGSSGFTLIELLVSITIIGLLTAIAVFAYGPVQKKTRDAKRKADLEAVRGALETYRVDFGVYPPSASVNAWGSPLTGVVGGSTVTYMQKLPIDPKSPKYVYFYNLWPAGGLNYQLGAYMESGGNYVPWGDCGDSVVQLCNYLVEQP